MRTTSDDRQTSSAPPRIIAQGATRSAKSAPGTIGIASGVVLTLLPIAAAWTTLAAAAVGVGKLAAIDYAEPVVYGQAMRLVSGERLYLPIDRPPFTVAAYTPLYYWLAAALHGVFGDGFGPGRALSFASGVACAVLVGGLAWRRGGSWWTGPFAAMLFLAFAFPRPDTPWLGLYRVDMLGVALSLGCIWLLRRSDTVAEATQPSPALRATSPRGRGGTDVVAGVLAGLALLCKQTLFAALIAGVLWRTRRSAAFAASALVTVVVPCIVLELTTHAFVENAAVANANPFYLVIAGGLLKEFIKAQWLPLLLAAAYLFVERPWIHKESRLLVMYWAVASVSLVWLGKIGANHNYWIEFAAATAVLAARGAERLATWRVPAIVAAAVMFFGVGGPQGVLDQARTMRSDVRELLSPAPDVEFAALVQRVRDAPDGVIAEPMDVVVLAGRQVVLEPFIYNLLLDEGRWKPDAVVASICNGEVGLTILGYPLEVAPRMSDGLHALWPPAVVAALQDTMTLEGVRAGRYVYTRSAGVPSCGRGR